MKKIVKYAVFLIFLFCINSSLYSQAEENWTDLDTYDQLEGVWEGSAVSHVKSDFINSVFETNLNIGIIFSYRKRDAFVSSVIKFDFTDFLTDLENIKGVKELGFTKEILWKMIKDEIDDDSISFDQYSILVESTELAADYFASDSRGKFLINKNKDTLLLIYYEPSFVLGIGDSGFTRMIFKRKYKF
ncbi:hypothetical protein [Treponema sp. R80B11-R83G3]